MEPQPADNLVDLLERLHGIVEPPPVSMLPQTWGWAVAAVLVAVVLAAGLVVFLRRRRATAYRRAALTELRALAPDLLGGEPAALARLETLLRRTALVGFPRGDVAALTGDAWTDFLARTGGEFGPLASRLAVAPYRPATGYDGAAALAAAKAWIARHHA